MATSNQVNTSTIEAGEDLSAVGCRFHAIAFDDGKLANNAEEASGILINDPASGEHSHLVVSGESKFAAGLAITKGAKLTVVTSGWFTTAESDDPIVGEAKYTVTSESYGTGQFNFNSAVYPTRTSIFDFTAAETLGVAGMAIALNDSKVANNAGEFSGLLTAAATSGTANGAHIVMSGVGIGRVGPAVAVGVNVMAGLSGYMIAITSGYGPNAQLLEAISSGQTGSMFVYGPFLTDFTD